MVKSNDFNTNGAKIMTNKMKRMVIDFTAVFFFLKTGSFNQRQMNGDIVMVDIKMSSLMDFLCFPHLQTRLHNLRWPSKQ